MFSVDLNAKRQRCGFQNISLAPSPCRTAAFLLKSSLCQAGRASPPPPSSQWREHVWLFWMLCFMPWRETSPDDISFQQVSCCHEEAETMNLLVLLDEAWGCPGCALCTGVLSVVRNNMCSCLDDNFLLPMMFSFLQPYSFVASQISLVTTCCGYIKQLVIKKNGSKSCWFRQGKKLNRV